MASVSVEEQHILPVPSQVSSCTPNQRYCSLHDRLHFILSPTKSIRGERHESAMGIVMNGKCLNRDSALAPGSTINRCQTRALWQCALSGVAQWLGFRQREQPEAQDATTGDRVHLLCRRSGWSVFLLPSTFWLICGSEFQTTPMTMLITLS